MTFSIGHVSGGTRAGWRRIRPTPKPWKCGCLVYERTDYGDERSALPGIPKQVWVRRSQPAYMTRCTDCGTRRP